MPRPLTDPELQKLLSMDVPASLATLDGAGYPHVTPVWFLWTGNEIVITSMVDKPHVRRLLADPRAGVCVHVEEAELDCGERPNRQVRVIGDAMVGIDGDGRWTRLITQKYVAGPSGQAVAERRGSQSRMAIRLPMTRYVAVASI